MVFTAKEIDSQETTVGRSTTMSNTAGMYFGETMCKSDRDIANYFPIPLWCTVFTYSDNWAPNTLAFCVLVLATLKYYQISRVFII